MLRLAVVFWIVGLMLADPILCRVEAVAMPCAKNCQAWHRVTDSHRGPVTPDHDSTHGCICQGATQGADARLDLAIEVQALNLVAILEPVSRRWGRLDDGWRRDDPPGRGRVGRGIRIMRQSFLI